MEDLQTRQAKPRHPSKLDDHALIAQTEFEKAMREALSVTPEEVQRREAEYQRQQADKRKK